jgi:hypothetical protein
MFILDDDPLHVLLVGKELRFIHEIPSEYLYFFDKVVGKPLEIPGRARPV